MTRFKPGDRIAIVNSGKFNGLTGTIVNYENSWLITIALDNPARLEELGGTLFKGFGLLARTSCQLIAPRKPYLEILI